MHEGIYAMHMRAGKAYGEEATCGKKIDYKSEETAIRSAAKMAVKVEKDFDAYPCYWCHGWHIGRAMTEEEAERFYYG